MSFEQHAAGAAEFENEILQAVYRGEAIAHAHAKLQEARSKDVALRDADAQGTYRHIQSVVKDYNGDQRRHLLMLLVPRRGVDNPESGIVKLQLDIPTQSWEKADDHSRNMYIANASAQQITMDALFVKQSTEPVLVPSQTFFATASRSDGSTLRVVIGPESIEAYEFTDDVVALPSSQSIGGQEYEVLDNLNTIEQKNRLQSDWFSAQQLRDYIKDSEPVTFGGYSNTSSVA